ncbi:hypothetical protein HKD37_09G024542 [Glycine soja]
MPLWEPMKIKGVCYPSVHLVKTFLASLMLSPSLISQPKTNGRSGVRRINIQLDIAMCTLWINTFWVIWFCRNQIRFQNNYPFFQGVQSMVSANVSLTGNHSKGCMAHSMSKFSLLKTFAMDIHPPKPFIVKRVDWFPHLLRVSIG